MIYDNKIERMHLCENNHKLTFLQSLEIKQYIKTIKYLEITTFRLFNIMLLKINKK